MKNKLYYEEDNKAVYIHMDGVLRHIVNPETFSNLFDGPITPADYIKFENASKAPYDIGTPIMNGAILVKNPDDARVYLKDIYPWDNNQNVVYRHIINPEQFNDFGFAWDKIVTENKNIVIYNSSKEGVPIDEDITNFNIIYYLTAYYNVYNVFAFKAKLNPYFESIYKRYPPVGINNLPAIKTEIIQWQDKLNELKEKY